jgi:DNA invertase Pin-like site-specific DNA recombinase
METALYIDEGVSGAKSDRPALNRLMDDCRKKKITHILIWRLDRLSRSLKHLITTIEELEHLGITLISYKENIDLGSPGGRLLVHMLAAFGEFERNIIRERVKAGLANAKRKGVRLGNKPLTVPHDDIIRLRREGMTIRQIATQVGCSVTPVMRVLKRGGL